MRSILHFLNILIFLVCKMFSYRIVEYHFSHQNQKFTLSYIYAFVVLQSFKVKCKKRVHGNPHLMKNCIR